MSTKGRLGMVPLMVETQAMRTRSKPSETVQRSLEFAFGALFLGLSAWHLGSAGSRLWCLTYLVAAGLSVVPIRNMSMLWITGMAGTGFAFGFFVVAGIAGQKPALNILNPDALGLLTAALWFGFLFMKEIRGNKGHDRLVGGSGEFINLRNLQR